MDGLVRMVLVVKCVGKLLPGTKLLLSGCGWLEITAVSRIEEGGNTA